MRTIRSEFERHGIKIRHKERPNKNKPKSNFEKLSERDLKVLMGVNRPTYKRHKGSYRQRS